MSAIAILPLLLMLLLAGLAVDVSSGSGNDTSF